jgi:hypothetical protein
MSLEWKESAFRRVNPSLGKQPNIGPLPADQLIPWVVIFLCFYYIFHGIFGLDWVWTGSAIAWGCSTWWVMTARGAYRWLSMFLPTPKWGVGFARYEKLVNSSSNKNRG